MRRLRRIGLFGGTFDPFHLGHLAVARAARDMLALDEVRLIPSHLPPHRPAQPHASPFHRFAMTVLAVASEDRMRVSDLELSEPGPSYTSYTLARLHQEGLRPNEIFFITGADAFAEIATWFDYPRLLDAAHFVVISRPGLPARSLRERMPALAHRMRDVPEPLPAPQAPPADGAELLVFLIDRPTPAVSGTAIREACAEGRPISSEVPEAVARHILKHALYLQSSTPESPAAGAPKAASELHEQEHA